jgi:hypothetical protein
MAWAIFKSSDILVHFLYQKHGRQNSQATNPKKSLQLF